MLNVFSNTKTLVIASLLAASSVFAQQDKNCRTQKMPEPMPAPMIAAYNAPSRVDVRGSWDFYLEGSFIYWLPTQDNMEFADSSSSATPFGGTTAAPVSNSIVRLLPNYKPGFQVLGGMTFDYDNWDSYVQYTWFHNTNTSSATALSGGGLFPTFGFPAVDDVDEDYASASASWNLKMDLADWVLSRPYYMSPRMTCRPMIGIRAAWIRQNYNLNYVRTASTANTLAVNNKSTSWGLGPQVGMTSNYMFGYGLRIFGDVNADVIYTRYSTSTASTDTDGSVENSVKEHGINTIRPHANIDLGFAWAPYFDDNNWHVDLMASYGFQVFWSQNMFRQFSTGTGFPGDTFFNNGNLYIQGLNLTARFDF